MSTRLLLVEDDAICAAVEKRLFESLDCTVTVATTSERAIALFVQSITDKTPYHAISMDIGLPDKDGLETCKVIRQYEMEHGSGTVPVPILAVTANSDDDILDRCLASGMGDVLPKPFTKDIAYQFLVKCRLKQ